jgi:glycosyltransferase involved in cell wall biosynthesis
MISIVIPTLNEEKYIGKTLGYISKYKGPHEIIISDTNSKDKTVEIARKYTDKVFIHSKEGKKLTIAAGRNFGASYASGDYLVFLDADICIIDPDAFFKKALSVFENNKKIVGITVPLKVFNEVATLSDKIITQLFIYWYTFLNNYMGFGIATGEFQMIRKNVFDELGGFNPLLVTYEDHNMFWRLAKVGKTYLETSIVAYHSGRRAHSVGWPKLLCTWTINCVSVLVLGKSVSKEWKVIR